MDVHKKLDEIVAAVGGARSMPMSASCVVNRAELLARLEELREALPGSLARAEEVLGGREQVVEEARREAERIVGAAHAQRAALVSDSEVARLSRDEADRILAQAAREAAEIRAQADDYVDAKLANFEAVLTKTLGSVDRGREKLLGRGPGLDDEGRPDPDAPEPGGDPETLRRQADAYADAKLATIEAVLAKTLEAVGRGRQKLLGRLPADDLGAHLAARDAEGAQPSRAASDADFLAGLAEPEPPAAPAPAIPAQAAAEPLYGGYGHPQPGGQDGYAYQDPYAYGQQPVPQPDPYAAAYGGQPDPYAAYGAPGPAGYPYPQQQAALDETSFFDTSMINLDQLRQYEQGR
ncbi:cell division initiation protein [Streptomyces toxytricini]|uniref:cell division initiation protein n=1 Tax=Streptomyces toxytricini TaxID=67369 RepID=UPI003415FBF3